MSRGSSPRAGRRRDGQHELVVLGGLIPAGGEATCPRSSCRAAARAHPRGRGGDAARGGDGMTALGSSPRAGRRRDGLASQAVAVGLIPAGGEATTAATRRRAWRRAHPRGRGGDDGRWIATVEAGGSSPRAGRRHQRTPAASTRCRLIPAGGEATLVRVGSGRVGGVIPAGGEATWLSEGGDPSNRAHPRGRGGDRQAIRAVTADAGSSPRAGRRLPLTGCRSASGGLIPAGGEATRPRTRSPWRPGAHPRGRGGDTSPSAPSNENVGSSPRAGRRRLHDGRGRRAEGLIPAGGEATRS